MVQIFYRPLLAIHFNDPTVDPRTPDSIVTPNGEIPWNRLSRISNDEMREFMKQVVDRIYTVLLRLDDPGFVERMEHYARRTTKAWDAPKNLTNWFAGG